MTKKLKKWSNFTIFELLVVYESKLYDDVKKTYIFANFGIIKTYIFANLWVLKTYIFANLALFGIYIFANRH